MTNMYLVLSSLFGMLLGAVYVIVFNVLLDRVIGRYRSNTGYVLIAMMVAYIAGACGLIWALIEFL